MLDNPWPGSTLTLQNASGSVPSILHRADSSVLFLFLAITLIFLVFYKKNFFAVTESFCLLKNNGKSASLLNDSFRNRSIIFALINLIPIYAIEFYREKLLSVSFWWFLSVILLFFIYRKFVLSILGWLSGKQSLFKSVTLLGYGITLLIFCLSAAISFVTYAFPGTNHSFVYIYLHIVAVTGIVVYFIRSFQLIAESGFSRSFWFLYLCTLEILPLAVLASIVIS